MAKRIVDESNLIAVADAIRGKSGGSDSLVFPDGFVTAIEGISADGGNSDDFEWFNDGNTHIWITLQEGRTSPKLGVCPNGTVTVDWGDGTAPDVLTGTSLSATKYTPVHEYTSAGDYIITLVIDGEMRIDGSILRHSTNQTYANAPYCAAIKAMEFDNKVTFGGNNPFSFCASVSKIKLQDGSYYFYSTRSSGFGGCSSLAHINIPDSVRSIPESCFSGCASLSEITFPNSVTSIGERVFYNCSSLSSFIFPDEITTVDKYSFYSCNALSSITLSSNTATISFGAFSGCRSLVTVKFPKTLTSIQSEAFYRCYSVRCYDFTSCSSVPELSNVSAFTDIPSDCEIRVPAALYDEWIAATNWSTYASQIVAV